MIPAKFTEDQLEQAILELLQQEGYAYVSGKSIHRSYESILLEDDLRSFLSSRYADESLTENEIVRIASRLELIPAAPLYEGNREAFRLVNEGFDLVRDNPQKIAVHINYVDFENPSNNIFKAVNQYDVQGEELRRPDVLLFVNGVPVAIVELKTAIEEGKTVVDAWKQIANRYCRDIPKLMKYCFLSVISDGVNTKMGSIFTPYEYYYAWNKINDRERAADGIGSLLTLIKGAFAPGRILKILQDFIFYPDDSKKNEAIVTRYPQFYGAYKMLRHIKNTFDQRGTAKEEPILVRPDAGKRLRCFFLPDCLFFANAKRLIIRRLSLSSTAKIWIPKRPGCSLPPSDFFTKKTFAA